MYAVPVPAYFVFDAFTCEIEYVIIYECLRFLDNHPNKSNWLPLAITFITSCAIKYSSTRKERSAKLVSEHFTGFPLREPRR